MNLAEFLLCKPRRPKLRLFSRRDARREGFRQKTHVIRISTAISAPRDDFPAHPLPLSLLSPMGNLPRHPVSTHRSIHSSRPSRGRKLGALLGAALLLCGLPMARAGTDVSKTITETAVEPSGPFQQGGHEFDLSASFLHSPIFVSKNSPTFNYARQDLSFGWMLSSPGAPGFFRGNWEVLLNVFGSEVTKGAGNFLAGGRLLCRYNFVQPDSRWVPFIQIGAGGLGDDVYRDRTQRLVGSGFEFTLVGNIGLRYFITPHCAIFGMADFEHISNANTASRNRGVNAGGGSLGIATFF